MRSEPKKRKDGICALPGCGKKLSTESHYGMEDAFCSTTCAKAWFGTSTGTSVNDGSC